MKYKLIIEEPVNDEITEAFLYYESLQKSLGFKLLDAIERSLKEIKLHPLTFQIKFNGFRTIHVKPFPFVLVYEVIGSDIIVYQFFNAKKNPRKRFKKS